jgi:hypothetical protein
MAKRQAKDIRPGATVILPLHGILRQAVVDKIFPHENNKEMVKLFIWLPERDGTIPYPCMASAEYDIVE